MTESDTEIELENVNEVLKRVKRPLFKRATKRACAETALADSDVTIDNGPKLYACTVNLKPNYIVNRKPWKKYSADKQRGILTRIEHALRKKTPSIQLLKLTFEECPVLGQIHFHALYSMPTVFKSEMEVYWERHSGNLPDTREPWRPIVIKEVFNETGWLDYINKDVKTI